MTTAPRDLTQNLAGQLALVTGAAGGLGAALTIALSANGATVVACDVNVEALDQVASGAGGRVHPQMCFRGHRAAR